QGGRSENMRLSEAEALRSQISRHAAVLRKRSGLILVVLLERLGVREPVAVGEVMIDFRVELVQVLRSGGSEYEVPDPEICSREVGKEERGLSRLARGRNHIVGKGLAC